MAASWLQRPLLTAAAGLVCVLGLGGVGCGDRTQADEVPTVSLQDTADALLLDETDGYPRFSAVDDDVTPETEAAECDVPLPATGGSPMASVMVTTPVGNFANESVRVYRSAETAEAVYRNLDERVRNGCLQSGDRVTAGSESILLTYRAVTAPTVGDESFAVLRTATVDLAGVPPKTIGVSVFRVGRVIGRVGVTPPATQPGLESELTDMASAAANRIRRSSDALPPQTSEAGPGDPSESAAVSTAAADTPWRGNARLEKAAKLITDLRYVGGGGEEFTRRVARTLWPDADTSGRGCVWGLFPDEQRKPYVVAWSSEGGYWGHIHLDETGDPTGVASSDAEPPPGNDPANLYWTPKPAYDCEVDLDGNIIIPGFVTSPTSSGPGEDTSQAPAPDGAPAATGDVAAGKTVFEANCQGCHPAGGTQESVGPQLNVTGLDAAGITNVVTNGRGAMPGGMVSGADLENVVAYVDSLKG